MLANTIDTFLHHHLSDPTQPLVVAVSGGVDSLALLHLLARCRPANKLIVAHLNHMLRAEAAADAQFVQDIAHQLSICCITQDVDVIQLAKQNKQTVEQAARHARYDFLAQVARSHGAGHVLTAHHADDQVETILMHWLRGAGLTGLQGMQLSAPVPSNHDIVLLRPLLTHPKNDLITYCHEHQLIPRIDNTNNDTTYFRNRIRHDLLPILNEISPHLSKQTAQMATVITADNALLDQLTSDAFTTICHVDMPASIEIDQLSWYALPLSLRRRTLRYAIAKLVGNSHDIGFRSIESVRVLAENNQTGTQFHLSSMLTLSIEYDRIVISRTNATFPITVPQISTPETTLFVDIPLVLKNEWILTATMMPFIDKQMIASNSDLWQAWLAIDDMQSCLLSVRGRQEGDTIQPLGMNGRHATIKAIMSNRKIPAAQRDKWPLILLNQTIAWIPGHSTSHTYRLTADTTTIIHIQCRRLLSTDQPK